MRTHYAIALAIGAWFVGAATTHNLHAQTKSKPKVYTVSEFEANDPAAGADVQLAARRAALATDGGRSLHTYGGKIVGMEGAAPPSRVSINEFDSLEHALEFY